MNRLKREKISSLIFAILATFSFSIGMYLDSFVLKLFGFVIIITVTGYSFYLNKQIKKQKEENQKRKLN